MIGCRLSLGSCCGIITETEAYAALGDKACHTWKRKSAREFIKKNQPGAAYVYLNYGMHWLLNFLVKGGERDGFVLIRSVEPISGIELMRERRRNKPPEELCDGPAKLTQAFAITGKYHGCDLLDDAKWEIFQPVFPVRIVDSTRIGISQETDLRWRFLLEGSRWVSAPA
jgi:DNA-3-methyladenine glycosylase